MGWLRILPTRTKKPVKSPCRRPLWGSLKFLDWLSQLSTWRAFFSAQWATKSARNQRLSPLLRDKIVEISQRTLISSNNLLSKIRLPTSWDIWNLVQQVPTHFARKMSRVKKQEGPNSKLLTFKARSTSSLSSWHVMALLPPEFYTLFLLFLLSWMPCNISSRFWDPYSPRGCITPVQTLAIQSNVTTSGCLNILNIGYLKIP